MQPIAMGAVTARTTRPFRKTKLRNRAPSNQEDCGEGQKGAVLEELERMDRRSLSEGSLRDGFVQTFVDFFYLMHRPAPVQESLMPGQVAPEIHVPPREMVFIRDNLVSAEAARRLGDTATAYQSFNNLAQYFQDVEDPTTGVYFYEKVT
ncbi:unnamed protein product [Chrysoparadoxa australica]